jgi:glutamine synthetase
VNRHQGLLRASIAGAGQDHRLGANEAPPAIISIFLGKELERVFGAIAEGRAGKSKPGSFLGLGTPVLPHLPLHAGDRNRTSPFAFTGNKFEFRALGSSQSPSFPNTVLNTIVAQAIDDLCEDLESTMGAGRGRSLEVSLPKVIGKSYKANRRVVFGGDNYATSWHREAEKRGLKNLRTTPDALPELVSDESLAVFSNYGVLNEREVRSRFEVFAEQYVTTVNIESETAADIARTMLLPAAVRYLGEVKAAGLDALAAELQGEVDAFDAAIRRLVDANDTKHHPHKDVITHGIYMRDSVLTAMTEVRTVADRLERMVADDLWPLPKYSEILFIK